VVRFGLETAPGLRFLMGPGQALPVSGVLAAGEADFSLEWIHGEADPVRFGAGSRLPAGAILLSRAEVVIEAGERWTDSLMAKLTAAPGGERGSPGLDRLLRVYLGVVLVFGLVAFGVWWWRGEWLTGLQAMISVFVVSCPCALGVAIPLADDMAASAMERLGVFVRTASIWPRLVRVRHVVFDKTGTLTLERPVLENPEAVSGLDGADALALARMTRGSLHPVSRSLLEALGTRGQKLLAEHGDAGTTEHPGLGVALTLADGDAWTLGKAGWDGGSAAVSAEVAGSELRRNGRVVAGFHFRESLRPGTEGMLRQLEKSGLTPHILSGDHPDKVRRISGMLGLSEEQSFGGLNPEEKEARVRALDHHDTLYLGDGANDSLAFDAAFVTGTPVVDRSLLESKADFYTLGSGLGFLPGLLATAAARRLAVRTAFGFALVYNLTTVVFSMAGHMSPLLAAVLMPLSSIVSILIVAGISGGKIRNKG
jgi:P-type Cu2+ transporter